MRLLGKFRAICPCCGQRLRDTNFKKMLVGTHLKPVYICPKCMAFLRRDTLQITGLRFALVCLFLLPFILIVVLTFYNEDFCCCIPLSPLFVIVWAHVVNAWQFGYSNTFEKWTPRCDACGYDMRCCDGDCPECGGKVEPFPVDEKPVSSLQDKNMQQRFESHSDE